MIAHNKTQLWQGKKVKERNWVIIPLAMFGNPNSKVMIFLHTRSLPDPNLFEIMWIWAMFMDMYSTGITIGV